MCENMVQVDPDNPRASRTTLPAFGALEQHNLGVKDGKIIWIEHENTCPNFTPSTEVIDGNDNLWLTPGLIDCHTHLVYGGDRAGEWAARLSGTSYEEIARNGGGILSSVRSTREASQESLTATAEKRLGRLLREGVTTVEIKSGYGLDLESELKMLRAAQGIDLPVNIETTLLGAHAVPPEFRNNANDYVDLVIREMIPTAKELNLCKAVDAFCESIAFDVQQTTRVLTAALDSGLMIKVHAEQLSNLGMAAKAAAMGAISADHLEYLTDADTEILAEHGTVAVLLPGAFYCLQETQKPPVAALLQNEVPLAIATDSNPGSSPVLSLLLMGNMACNLFGLTPEQSLKGMTINAARALGLQDRVGSLTVGKQADLAIWDVNSPGEIFYQLGGEPCIGHFKDGSRVR